MMRRLFVYLVSSMLIVAMSLVFFPLVAKARIGVGIGTGKMVVQKKLKPGGIYTISSVGIINTGDQSGDYGIDIQYNEKQSQHKPPVDWFQFSPVSFHLKPGEAKTVKITLIIPVKAKPGDYFAYIEGRPVIKQKTGSAMIGVAAAAKLYFTIAPANIFQAIIYRTTAFWNKYSPWTWIVLVIIILALSWRWFKSRFHFQLSLTKK